MKKKFILILASLIAISPLNLAAEGNGKETPGPQAPPTAEPSFDATARIDGDGYVEIEPGQTGSISALVTVTLKKRDSNKHYVSGLSLIHI